MQFVLARARSLVASLVLLAGVLQAQVASGQQFTELSPPVPPAAGAGIEVIEFFWYGCPVCYETQPHLARWHARAGNDVVLRRVPAISADGWDLFARSYFTLESMGLLGRLHWAVYDNFHFDGKRLNEESVITAWVASNGGDGAKFGEIWKSPETQAKVDAARALLDTYKVRGVPTFIVDGKYATSARMAGSVPQMITVLDQLVARARAERGKK